MSDGYIGPTTYYPADRAKNVIKALELRNMSMSELARRIGTDRKTIYRFIWTGETKLSTFIKMCDVLQISCDEACGRKR